MTRQNFLYWLQGYFELCEAAGHHVLRLDQKTFQCVTNHAHLVYAAEGLEYGAALPRPGADTLVFDWLVAFSPNDGGLNERSTAVLRRLLNAAFKHVIDPAAGGPDMQEKLNAIHGSGGHDGEVMRC